jgi:hypothetical protein
VYCACPVIRLEPRRSRTCHAELEAATPKGYATDSGENGAGTSEPYESKAYESKAYESKAYKRRARKRGLQVSR